MHDALLVHVVDSLKKSFHNFFGFNFAREAILLEVAIKRETKKFHNNVSGIFRFKNTLKLADIFVVEFAQKSKLFFERNLKSKVNLPLHYCFIK